MVQLPLKAFFTSSLYLRRPQKIRLNVFFLSIENYRVNLNLEVYQGSLIVN